MQQMLPGAIFAGIILFVFELAAGALITHAAAGQKNAAGTVSTVLGMLWFFALAGQVILYGAEINVVKVEKLWPRGLVDAPDTQADHRAYEAYAQEKTYRPNQKRGPRGSTSEVSETESDCRHRRLAPRPAVSTTLITAGVTPEKGGHRAATGSAGPGATPSGQAGSAAGG